MSGPVPIGRANTIVYCNRWKECVRFYRDGLGLEVTFNNDWFVEFSLNSACALSIADARRASVDSAQGRGITLTLKVEDIRAAHRALLDNGLFPGEIKKHPWGAMVFYLRDPDGNRIEYWSSKKD